MTASELSVLSSYLNSTVGALFQMFVSAIPFTVQVMALLFVIGFFAWLFRRLITLVSFRTRY